MKRLMAQHRDNASPEAGTDDQILHTYRILSPALAFFSESGQQVSRALPKGTTVTVDRTTFSGNKLIEVVCDGKLAMMFTQDLRARGRKVE